MERDTNTNRRGIQVAGEKATQRRVIKAARKERYR